VEPAAASAAPNKAPGAGLLAGLVKFVWVATVLVWPILKWVLSIATFFQFVRMLYHWNTPGVYAGWSFLAYFAVLTGVVVLFMHFLTVSLEILFLFSELWIRRFRVSRPFCAISYGFTTLARWARLGRAAYSLRSAYAVCAEYWRWQSLPPDVQRVAP
jgi:hypothetical protein